MNYKLKMNLDENYMQKSKKEILVEYEKKYLLKFEKAQAEIKRLVEQQKQIEFKELKERISRRLKLEKESGKDYTIYLKNKLDSIRYIVCHLKKKLQMLSPFR